MCKKFTIAVVAVVIALSVAYFFPKVRSHAKVKWHNLQQFAAEQITPEEEIERLEMELRDLAKDDDKHFHKVAVQKVEVQKLERLVSTMKARLDNETAAIKEMHASYTASKNNVVHYNKEEFAKPAFHNTLRSRASRFQVDEELYQSKKEQLELRRASLEANEQKLSQLRLVREKMQSELENLKIELIKERQRVAIENNTLDDAGYQRLRQNVNEVKDKIEVFKTKRVLKGEVDGPVRASEERKKQEAAIDRFIESRFGDNKQ